MRRCEDCGAILRTSGVCPRCDELWPAELTDGRRRPDRDPARRAIDGMVAEQALEAAAAYGTEVSM